MQTGAGVGRGARTGWRALRRVGTQALSVSPFVEPIPCLLQVGCDTHSVPLRTCVPLCAARTPVGSWRRRARMSSRCRPQPHQAASVRERQESQLALLCEAYSASDAYWASTRSQTARSCRPLLLRVVRLYPASCIAFCSLPSFSSLAAPWGPECRRRRNLESKRGSNSSPCTLATCSTRPTAADVWPRGQLAPAPVPRTPCSA